MWGEVSRTGQLPLTLGGATVRTQIVATFHVPQDAGKEPGELANLHNKSNGQELWGPGSQRGPYFTEYLRIPEALASESWFWRSATGLEQTLLWKTFLKYQ